MIRLCVCIAELMRYQSIFDDKRECLDYADCMACVLRLADLGHELK